ncbi:choline dehydrogenase [Aestuariivirga litoralis]|uniref:Oxygen-dependent choline dehydrogenase n=1 Tax=Aestuariivirga litoralis TaxID=2650924 RepID=A0A2W2AYL9_9HYPH|nr:choline dehydrogenase [Aestuariivirga litoralis]PZF78872.1 choline dehydrogenase [Aestuariivirga litoralis]
MSETFDFVIVGAGSAGCAMAYRLAEDGKNSVCVLEFGGSDRGPFIQMPSALSYPMNMKLYNWGFESDPEPGLGGRRLATPRGKVVGGSSSINGMVYVRGHAKDFDTWEEMGAKGWGFRHVLPYFKRQESCPDGEDGWRGTKGPLHIKRGPRDNPLYQAFVEAGRQAGYPVTDDYNGRQQEGFGPMEMTVHKGIRWSAANAYLKPALKRGNVKLITRAFAHRVILEGKRAVGVEYDVGGQVREVRARREVIVAASTINSPKLLQMSGIGAPEVLKKAGIAVAHALPGVGENLQDHLEIYFQIKSKEPVTLYSKLNWFSKGLIGAEWLFFKTGLGSTNHFETCGFIRSAAGIEYPDIQYHFLPAAMRYDGQAAFPGHGFQVHVGPMRAKSRGFVRVRSGQVREAPQILFNYLTHPDDLPEWRRAVRLTRELFQQPAMQRFAAEEIQPGRKVNADAEIDAFIREHCESAYHPCGTCKMGDAKDPTAVVDPECRVIGIENLRVADSSIMPQVTNGNLNGPTIMIGEKASDHILGRQPMAPSNQEPWINPDWKISQR